VNTVIDKQNIFAKLEQTAKSICNYWLKAIKD
jgi:hypothetical protein